MHTCNLCGSSNLLPIIHFGNHPITHHYLKTGDQHDEYTHSFELQFCEECGLTQVVDHIPPELFYSELFALSTWKNQPHIQHEIGLIRGLPGINSNSMIVEIASNDGIFCRALLDAGYRHCIGIEPAKDAQEAARAKGVETIGAYFNVDTAKRFVEAHGQANLVIARQMLEHVPDPHEIQRALKIILAPGGHLLLEIVDFACSLELFDFALWEEHINLYTIETLKIFTEAIGLNVNHVETVVFSGRSLIMIASNTGNPIVDQDKTYLPDLRKANIRYKETWPLFRTALREYLETNKKQGGKTVIYGAGGRACALVNYAGLGEYIDYFIDDQMEKQGLLVPGSHLPILPSSALNSEGINLCLLAVNTENEDRVLAKHKAWIENGGRFFSIYPPTDRLLPFWKELIHPV